MQPMKIIRDWHLDMLRKAVPVIGHIVQTTSQADATTYQDGGAGWTALEVLCHLRDWDAIILDRARMTMAQDIPVLPNPDPDEAAIEREYNLQDWPTVYEEWVQRRDLLAQCFESVGDTEWERPGSHPKRGLFTLTDQLLLTAWHDMNHTEQMARILAEKQPSSHQ
jgi:hypothetical protein